MGLSEEPIRDEVRVYMRARETSTPLAVRNPFQPPKETRTRRMQIQDRLLGVIVWQESQKEPQMNLERIVKEAKDAVGDGFELLRAASEEENTKRVFESEAMYGNSPGTVEKAADELLLALREETLKEERELVVKRLKECEIVGDEAGIDENAKLCQDIDLALLKLKSSY